jgi:hypothetical protein
MTIRRFVLVLCLILICAGPGFASDAGMDLLCLSEAYPGAFSVEDGPGGPVLVMRGGARLPYDDGRAKSAEEALDAPSVKDMLEQVYPLGLAGREPAEGFHPGRRRVTAFFTALYGASKAEVAAQCVSVQFAGKKLRFSGNFGAAEALEAVGREIAELLKTRPDLRSYVFPVSTVAWRAIAGVDRLSMHSLGIAVDLNPRLGSYWGWSAPGAPSPAKSYPYELVEIFERHGFIWGGKWREFDLMHFEYRPELLCKAKRLQSQGAGAAQPVSGPSPDSAPSK